MVSLRFTTFLGLLAAALFLTFFLLRSADMPTSSLRGQTLSRDALLETQIKADFRRDGKIDFVDFTFFSSFYEE